MGKSKFLLGDTIVTVWIENDSTIKVTDGTEEWVATIDQIKQSYTPVSETAEYFEDMYNTKQDEH